MNCFFICSASEPSSLLKNIPVIPISKATKRSFMERPPSPERPRYRVKRSKGEFVFHTTCFQKYTSSYLSYRKYIWKIRLKKRHVNANLSVYLFTYAHICCFLLLSSLPLRPQPRNSGNFYYILFICVIWMLKLLPLLCYLYSYKHYGWHITPIFHVFSIHLGEIKRSTSMSFVEGNLGTWPKEKRFVTCRLWRSSTLFGSSESCIIVML